MQTSETSHFCFLLSSFLLCLPRIGNRFCTIFGGSAQRFPLFSRVFVEMGTGPVHGTRQHRRGLRGFSENGVRPSWAQHHTKFRRLRYVPMRLVVPALLRPGRSHSELFPTFGTAWGGVGTGLGWHEIARIINDCRAWDSGTAWRGRYGAKAKAEG